MKAIIIIDMWDKHWNQQVNQRNIQLAKNINTYINNERKKGNIIIHNPNNCKKYYLKHSSWLNTKNIIDNKIIKKFKKKIFDDKLKTDFVINMPYIWKDPDHIIKNKIYPWKKQTDLISINEMDYIAFKGSDVMCILNKHNITELIYTGVHLNCCITWTRTTSVLIMKSNNINCEIEYDLTDTIYDERYSKYAQNWIESKKLFINYFINNIN